MASTVFIKADEVAAELGNFKISGIPHDSSVERGIEAKGYTTVIGRVSRQYYHEKCMAEWRREVKICQLIKTQRKAHGSCHSIMKTGKA